jgi:hypothetical protein
VVNYGANARREMTAALLACGLDPASCHIFRQSAVRAVVVLASCTAHSFALVSSGFRIVSCPGSPALGIVLVTDVQNSNWLAEPNDPVQAKVSVRSQCCHVRLVFVSCVDGSGHSSVQSCG